MSDPTHSGAPTGRVRPDITALHRSLRWTVLGLVVAWMAGMAAFNLFASRKLVEAEFYHHMNDQVQSLAHTLQSRLRGGEDLAGALRTVMSWPGRVHELDVLAPGGELIASTAGRRPDEDLSYGVTQSIDSPRGPLSLRLWMHTEEISRQYHHVALLNLAAVVCGGILLALLMAFATGRATRSYDLLVRQIEALEARQARAARLEGMGRMAAGVAHEIRNPLNALGLGLQRIGKELLPSVPGLDPSWSQIVGQLYSEVRRLNGVVEEFLSAARPVSLAIAEFDLADLLGGLGNVYGLEARQAGVQLDVAVPARPLPLRADRSKLQQLLINVIRNGIEAAAAADGLRLVEVHVEDNEQDRYRIRVSNSGPGPAGGDFGRLFEMFYTTKHKGAGLGLSNALRIAEAHGGELRGAREGDRTVFTLLLPRESSAG